MTDKGEKDSVTGQYTTGHEWDGIRELNTPLPRWWVWVFLACIVWAIGYCIAYPSIPGVSGAWQGVLGWHSRDQVAKELAQAKAAKAVYLSKIEAASVDDIVKDRDLLNFAMAGGAAIFGDNCAACHGAGGAGAYGYPNLTDDQWLWGGTAEEIRATITYGVRTANANTHISEMPAFGGGDPMGDSDLADLAEYVLSLSKASTDPAAAGRGEAAFAERCVACHGEDGSGNQAMGAPSLASGLWLFKARAAGGQKAEIVAQIKAPRNNVMPSWSDRGLDETTIKLLTVYVHSLGGGQ